MPEPPLRAHKLRNTFHQFLIAKSKNYRMEGNFGRGKRWRIWQMIINSPKFLPPTFPIKFNLKCDRHKFTPFIMLILKQPSNVLANPLDKRITSYSKFHLTMPLPLFVKRYPIKYKRSLVVHAINPYKQSIWPRIYRIKDQTGFCKDLHVTPHFMMLFQQNRLHHSFML